MATDELPDLTVLRMLSLVGETGSMSAAAGRLGITQQAVSLRIRSLEQRLGVRLATRAASGSVLTPAGILVTQWSADLLGAAERVASDLRSLRHDGRPTARVAASLTIAEQLLPSWTLALRRERGDLELRLDAANSTAVIDLVRRGLVDLGLIETPDVPPDLGSVRIGTDEIVVVVAPQHPWARRQSITLDELTSTPLVLREEGSGSRRAFEAELERRGLRLSATPAAALTSNLALRAMAQAGAAPSVLSLLAVREELAAGALVRVDVDGFRCLRPLTAVWAGASPTAAASQVLAVVERMGHPPGGGA